MVMARIWIPAVSPLMVLAASGRGQETVGGDSGQTPQELRIRFTPGMARAMGNTFAREVFVRRYGLDETKADAAAEAIAGRLLEAAHALDSIESQHAVERMVEAMMRSALSRMRGEPGEALRGMISGELARAAGQGLGPMLPTIRTLIRDVGRDMLPMLPARERVKLTADWMAVGTALNGFEKVMERWAAGDIKMEDNPFEPNERRRETEPPNRPAEMETFRAALDRKLETDRIESWERYVQQAKVYYQFDNAQATSAEGILADCAARATRIIEDDAWRERAHWERVWLYLASKLPGGAYNPFYGRLSHDRTVRDAPISALEDELKSRIDQLASEKQRRAAETRVLGALQEQGYTRPE